MDKTLPTVTAVIVTQGKTPYLKYTLDFVRQQDHRPDSIVIVDWSHPSSSQHLQPDDIREAAIRAYLVEVKGARNLGDALRRALDDLPVENDYLWILHDDSAPKADSLDILLRALDKNSATEGIKPVGIAGMMQYVWGAHQRIEEVGIVATRHAHRLIDTEPAELDQGQYYSRCDVAGVGTAGMLIKRALWEKLEGCDPALGPFGDGLELSRRAQLSGYRVIVVPQAIVYHAKARYRGLRSLHFSAGSPDGSIPEALPDQATPSASLRGRRQAFLYNWALTLPAPLFGVSGIWVIITGICRAVVSLLSKNPHAAWAYLVASFHFLGQYSKIARSRASIAQLRSINPEGRIITAATWQHKWRHLRYHIVQRYRSDEDPLEPVAAQALAIKKQRAHVITALFAIVGVIVSMIAMRAWFGAVSGGAWTHIPPTWTDLWHNAWATWTPSGDGYASAPPPMMIIFALLSAPFAVCGIDPPRVISLMMTFMPVAALLSAWWGFAAITRQLPARALMAVAWIAWPAFLVSLWHADIVSGIVHVCLPVAVWGIAYASGWGANDIVAGATHDIGVASALRQSTAAATAAIATTIIMAANVLMGVLCVVAMILAALSAIIVKTIRKKHPNVMASDVRVYSPRSIPFQSAPALLVAAVAPVLIVVPSYVTYLRHKGSLTHLLWDHSAGTSFYSTASPGQVVAGLPLPYEQLPVHSPQLVVVWLVFYGAVTAFSLYAFVRIRRAFTIRIAWILALTGAICASYARYVVIAFVPDPATGQIVSLTAWPAPFQTLMWAGIVMAAGAGSELMFRTHPPLRPRIVKTAVGVVVAGVMILPVVTTIAWTAMSGYVMNKNEDERWGHPAQESTLPVSVRLSQESGRMSRIIHLRARDNRSIDMTIYRLDGPSFNDSSVFMHYGHMYAHYDDADREFASIIAAMSAGNAPDAGKILTNHGVEMIVTPLCRETACQRLADGLASNHDIQRNGASRNVGMWRVVTPPTAPVSRVRIISPQGTEGLASGVVDVTTSVKPATHSRTVIMSERYASHWQASIAGEPLLSHREGWRQAFTIPAHASGTLEITYREPWQKLWWILSGISIACAIGGAVPLQRRVEV
ncbi:MAG: glycosyltransferase [Actinomycetaceae bacterium]|nr:glycosyltransferase [Actinomycetaceae bacterium]